MPTLKSLSFMYLVNFGQNLVGFTTVYHDHGWPPCVLSSPWWEAHMRRDCRIYMGVVGCWWSILKWAMGSWRGSVWPSCGCDSCCLAFSVAFFGLPFFHETSLTWDLTGGCGLAWPKEGTLTHELLVGLRLKKRGSEDWSKRTGLHVWHLDF